MSDEIKDQRIGRLRQVLAAVAAGVAIVSPDIADAIDNALKEDDNIAGTGPVPVGEQLRELAASHRETAIKTMVALLAVAMPGISSGTLREYAQDFVEEVVAAAGYEAEARARLRSTP